MPPSAKFWDKIADKYYRDPISDMATYEQKLGITREYFTPESEILEFGCGTGGTAVLHAPYVRHILATDISEAMLEYGRRRVQEAGIDNITFECAAVDQLQVPAASRDVVLGMSILHLVADRDAVIRKVFEVLKPGGIFVSSTICMADEFGFMRPIFPVARAMGVFPMVRFFTADQLRSSITRAGFTIEYDWHPGKRKALFLVARKPG